ncbi:MAG: hypothetical protein JST85_08520 [Acidobacteria bacterium]|nr:hypothetical protein [Acidobacteriota bacterium]
MKNSLFKVSVLLLFCVLFLAFGLKGARVAAYVTGPDPARTGAPGEQTCAMSGCHVGNNNVNTGGGTLTIAGLPSNYSLGQSVDVTVTLALSGRTRFGFEVTAIDDQGRQAGTLTVTNSQRTQLTIPAVVAGNPRQYITHREAGTLSANQNSWTFRWTPPAQSVGRITFYAAGNAANNNGSESGDLIYTTSVSVQAPLASVATVSSASFAQNVALAPNMIVSAFSGAALSQNVVIASTNPLPTQLDGTEIEIRDFTSTTRKAGLFFVAPSQINYWIPTGVPNGIATVTVKRNGTAVAEGTVTIDSTSPGIFTANASGSGVPAAFVLRVVGSDQITESIYTSQSGQPVATPIDLATGDVYLILYGTGVVGAAANSVSATIGGTSTPILGFAAAPGFVGLDQINVGPIPKSLAGRGNADVVLTVGTKNANMVTINLK